MAFLFHVSEVCFEETWAEEEQNYIKVKEGIFT